MAGAGKKTFTAGETLTASDVNTYLMEQSVMYFGGTAARASAIPTPSTGMTTYIGVTGTATIPQLETYTGSQWQTPYGLTLVSNVTFSSVASISIDNVFTSTYTNYLVQISLDSSSLTDNGTMRLRSAGSTVSASNYFYSHVYQSLGSSTVNGAAGANSTGWNDVMRCDAGGATAFGNILISYPQQAKKTLIHQHLTDSSVWRMYGGLYNATTQCDGIYWTMNSGTATGNIRIYGLRNS